MSAGASPGHCGRGARRHNSSGSRGLKRGIGRGAHHGARGRRLEVGGAREAANLLTNGGGRGGEDGSIHAYGVAPVERKHGDDGVDDEEVPGQPPGRWGG